MKGGNIVICVTLKAMACDDETGNHTKLNWISDISECWLGQCMFNVANKYISMCTLVLP